MRALLRILVFCSLTIALRAPGADLIASGSAEVAGGRETAAGELVKIGSPRMRDCGIELQVMRAMLSRLTVGFIDCSARFTGILRSRNIMR